MGFGAGGRGAAISTLHAMNVSALKEVATEESKSQRAGWIDLDGEIPGLAAIFAMGKRIEIAVAAAEDEYPPEAVIVEVEQDAFWTALGGAETDLAILRDPASAVASSRPGVEPNGNGGVKGREHQPSDNEALDPESPGFCTAGREVQRWVNDFRIHYCDNCAR